MSCIKIRSEYDVESEMNLGGSDGGGTGREDGDRCRGWWSERPARVDAPHAGSVGELTRGFVFCYRVSVAGVFLIRRMQSAGGACAVASLSLGRVR